MAFEPLSYSYPLSINDFPENWIPLVHLYDPDLPSFPIYYFHVLSPTISHGALPNSTERAFGYIQKINFLSENRAEIIIQTNKDFTNNQNEVLKLEVEKEIKERLGLISPVVIEDITNIFQSPTEGNYNQQNNLTRLLWNHVVSETYGNKLPFGRLWDGVLGLGRFVASFNSPTGRKGEMIMTHYYASRFGEKISSTKKIDFFLLPTIDELTDQTNPLDPFPKFKKLVDTAKIFCRNCCELQNFSGYSLSKFTKNLAGTNSFDTKKIKSIFNHELPSANRPVAYECFNTFNRGPQRSIVFFMMLNDIRMGHISPKSLTPQQCGEMYDKAASSYQSPKVIQLYSQQCFGNTHAMPIDTWVESFLKWPYGIYPKPYTKNKFIRIFSMSEHLGKLERLLWITAQARKVHSSACDDRLWCIKYGFSEDDEEIIDDNDDKNKNPRGANPLSCGICDISTRDTCPAYERIKNSKITFNSDSINDVEFVIWSSSKNNINHDQKFILCEGKNKYVTTGKNKILRDNFSPTDKPESFTAFPSGNHSGEIITVKEFIRIYAR